MLVTLPPELLLSLAGYLPVRDAVCGLGGAAPSTWQHVGGASCSDALWNNILIKQLRKSGPRLDRPASSCAGTPAAGAATTTGGGGAAAAALSPPVPGAWRAWFTRRYMIQRGWVAGQCTRYPVVAHSGPVFGVAVLDPAISSQRDDDGGGGDDEEGFLSLTAVSVGADGQMIVWGPMGQTLRPKVEVGAHRGGSGGVLGLAVDHTNGLVFTGSMLGEIRAWSVGPDPATPPSAAVPGEGGRGGGGGVDRHDSASPEVRHQRRRRVGGGGKWKSVFRG